MISSIFKSFATCAFLLASPIYAIDNFDVNFLQVITSFDKDSTNEITLKYEIGTGRTSYEVDLFASGCTAAISGTTVDSTSVVTAKDTTHDSLDILLDLDKSTIAGSNMWDLGSLTLCARIQLLSGTTVMSEESRDIEVTFDFEVDFVGTNDVNFSQASLASGTTSTTINNYVQACTCNDATSFTCNQTPITPTAPMNVCIKSLSTDMNIDYIQSLKMQQGTKEFKVYDAGDIQNSAITSEEKVPTNNGVFISSLVPAEFFSYGSTSTATLSGLVFLALPGSRRLTAVEITGRPKVVATGSTRVLTKRFGDQVSPFVIDLQLEKKEFGGAANAAVQYGYGFGSLTYIAPIIVSILIAMIM